MEIPLGKETQKTHKHNWIKYYMFFEIIYNAIDQGYMGNNLASCHKDKIWDFRAEMGLIWDHFRAFSQLGPSPEFGTSFQALFLLFGFFLFRGQIFRNQDFFPRPNFSITETDTFFWNQIFSKPKPILLLETKFSDTETETLKNWQ